MTLSTTTDDAAASTLVRRAVPPRQSMTASKETFMQCSAITSCEELCSSVKSSAWNPLCDAGRRTEEEEEEVVVEEGPRCGGSLQSVRFRKTESACDTRHPNP